MVELTKAELQQILTEVTKEYEEVVKSEQLEKMMGMGAGPTATPKLSTKVNKEKKAQSAGPGDPNKKLGMKDAFNSLNKEETTLEGEETTKPEAPRAEDSMPEGSDLEKSAVIKAEGDDDGPPKEEKEPDAAPPAPKEDPSGPPADEAGPPVEMETEAPAVDAPPQEQVPGQDDAGMSPEQLNELYCGLSPEHLAMHWMAASQALFQSMSGEQPQQEVAPQMQPPAPAAPAQAPQGMPNMAKTEVKESDEFKTLQKNFDSLKEQNDLLEKNLEILTDKLSAKLGMPVLNAVTSDTVISKSEQPARQLSKSEVVSMLNEKAKDQKLSEADKKKIYQYSVNPAVTQELKDFLGVK